MIIITKKKRQRAYINLQRQICSKIICILQIRINMLILMFLAKQKVIKRQVQVGNQDMLNIILIMDQGWKPKIPIRILMTPI